MTPKDLKAILYTGILLIGAALIGMIVYHEFLISQWFFIIGAVTAGYAYTQTYKEEKMLINTEQINKNIQTFNNILWGKKE